MDSSSSNTQRDPDPFGLKNDVFMSYSFDDVGLNFISHLRGALLRNCFTVSGHSLLPVGQDLCSELLKAIEESEIFIVVFSCSYASSVRCLDELVSIMDCHRKLKGRRVLPVFYKVDPHDVTSQQAGPFMEAFRAHEINEDRDMVRKWKEALKEAGQLPRLTLQIGDEAKFVSEIVEAVEKLKSPHKLHITEYPVGIRSRAEELISTLRLDSKNEVLVAAVIGFSGIGKTAIVKEAFNQIASEFDVSCFLPDIYNICQVPNWRVVLQEKLISCLTRAPIMLHHADGVTKIKRCVRGRRILLVLDNVDDFRQLEAMGINSPWFYKGSRIIVTTRDQRSLGNIPFASYRVTLLNRKESLNLFMRLMFSSVYPSHTKFTEEVVFYAGGIPLVLKVWSDHFQQYGREEWPNILEILKRITHGDIHKQMKRGYDSLTYRAQKFFLDLACFFVGHDKDLVVKVLQDLDTAFFPSYELQYLVDKSLVQITGPKIVMHHVIREMGEEIVRQEDEDEPGKRIRLCDERDVMRVLTECSGTGLVESINLFSSSPYENVIEPEALSKMNNLRLISFRAKLSFGKFQDDDEVPTFCLRKLRFMEWWWFPFKSIDNIEMSNVVVLRLKHCKLETLWQGIKFLKKLRILDVSESSLLRRTGDFYGLENVEELTFHHCKNLKEVHGSIGRLHKLTSLNLGSCGVSRVPSEIGNLVLLKQLDLSENPFSSLPDSFRNLSQLVSLDISHCSKLRLLPLLPSNLEHINAVGCDSLDIMPFDSKLAGYIFRTKLGKESPFTKPLSVQFSWKEEVPNWCSHKPSTNVLSFTTPMQLDKDICGILFYAQGRIRCAPYLQNITKSTSHHLSGFYGYGVVFYPLDVTTLVVETGDDLLLKSYTDSNSRWGLRLIYDTDVVDSGLVIRDVDVPNPPIPSEMIVIGNAQLNDISVDSGDDYTSALSDSFSDYDSNDGHKSDWDDAYCSFGDNEDELL